MKLRLGASVVRYAPPELVLSGARPVSADTLGDLNAALKSLSGKPWRVSLADQPGAPTLRELEKQAEEEARTAILATPLVRAALEAFPDAVLEDWPGKRSA